MSKRGRPSSLDATVVVAGKFGNRPDPPPDLNERQAEIWKATVASEPADFFNTAALRALLVDYCRHREAADSISAILNQFKPEWIRTENGSSKYMALLKMRDLETRGAITCATKLRMTNQARYTPQAANTASKNVAQGQRPWEFTG